MKKYFLLAGLSMASSLVGSDDATSLDRSPFTTRICVNTGIENVFCDLYYAKKEKLEEIAPGLSTKVAVAVVSIRNGRTDQKQIHVSLSTTAPHKDPFDSEMISYWHPDYAADGVGLEVAEQRIGIFEIASAFLGVGLYKQQQLTPSKLTYFAGGAIACHCLFKAWAYAHKKSHESLLDTRIAHFKKCIPWLEKATKGCQDFICMVPLSPDGAYPSLSSLLNIKLID